jgi:hypothetical protein
MKEVQSLFDSEIESWKTFWKHETVQRIQTSFESFVWMIISQHVFEQDETRFHVFQWKWIKQDNCDRPSDFIVQFVVVIDDEFDEFILCFHLFRKQFSHVFVCFW